MKGRGEKERKGKERESGEEKGQGGSPGADRVFRNCRMSG